MFKPIPAQFTLDLYHALIAARRTQLQPALGHVVGELGVASIDADLQRLVPSAALTHVAGLGLRGERVFPVPVVIAHAPQLIGYYRMLLGVSKKEFGQSGRLGYGPWVTAEETGRLSARLLLQLDAFCAALISPLAEAVVSMGQFTDCDLNDIALLTLGSTLQGGRNNVIGSQAATNIFAAIARLLAPWITLQTPKSLRLVVPSDRQAEVLVGTDPDIQVNWGSGAGSEPLLAIEIKGGGDASNAHNRAGEAEKSHIKAQLQGYRHRWTIIRMHQGSAAQIRAETPTSTAVFEAAHILDQHGEDWDAFGAKLLDLLTAV